MRRQVFIPEQPCLSWLQGATHANALELAGMPTWIISRLWCLTVIDLHSSQACWSE